MIDESNTMRTEICHFIKQLMVVVMGNFEELFCWHGEIKSSTGVGAKDGEKLETPDNLVLK